MTQTVNVEQIAQQTVQIAKSSKKSALSMFNAFIKDNVTDLSLKERLYILRYQSSCLFWECMYIPRLTNKTKQNGYDFTIIKLLSAFVQLANCKLSVSRISKSRIFFKESTDTYGDTERVGRLLFSELITLNSFKYDIENNVQLAVNPLEKTLKLTIKDRYGYSEIAFDNFSIKHILHNGEDTNVIYNAGEVDGRMVPGTIVKVDYKFIAGLHYIVPTENYKDVLAYRYQKFAKTLDRFISYDIKHNIDWDKLLCKSIYNIIG